MLVVLLLVILVILVPIPLAHHVHVLHHIVVGDVHLVIHVPIPLARHLVHAQAQELVVDVQIMI